jgi:prepilin-type N-terminal cleavage/methylation domain-containing protein
MLSNARSDRSEQPKRGITLLELLIVMVILLMVTAAAIPIMAPALRNRQMREATRLVSAYLGAARARAVQTGRPVGVIIERDNGKPYALQMSQVEVPLPYAGDFSGSAALATPISFKSAITNAQNGAGGLVRITSATQFPSFMRTGLFVNVQGVQGTVEANGKFRATLINSTTIDLQSTTFATAYTSGGTLEVNFGGQIQALPNDTEWLTKIRYGDRIRFDHRGKFYYITSIPLADPLSTDPRIGEAITVAPPGTAAAGFWFLTPESNSETVIPPGYSNPLFGVPYQIMRQPMRSNAQPLTLPDGIVVDLTVSGVGSQLFNSANYNIPTGDPVPDPLITFDPMVIFSPSGRVDWVTNQAGQLARPLASINLLMGRREFMYDVTKKSVIGNPVATDLVVQNLSAIPTTSTTLMPPSENFWMTIGYQTGTVSVSQVAPHYQVYDGTSFGGVSFSDKKSVLDFTLNGNGTAAYPGALGFARESQSLGGR